MSKKPPYIKLFIKDFAFDIQDMDNDEIALYIKSFIKAYKTGEIPEKNMEKTLFIELKNTIEKYDGVCKRNKENRTKTTNYKNESSTTGQPLVNHSVNILTNNQEHTNQNTPIVPKGDLVISEKVKDPINQVCDIFYECYGPGVNYYTKTQRDAVQEMINLYTLDKVIDMALLVCAPHPPEEFFPFFSTPKSLLARSDLNLSAVSINGTVPVIWYSNNLTMASTYAGLWTLAQGTSWYIQTAVTNVLGSVGQNQTYWTGADQNGNYINAASSCGGNWTVNTTGNVGLTGTNDGGWMNYSTPPICGVVARPYLCVCESFATPLSVPNNIGSDTPVVIGCVIAAIVVVGMILFVGTYVFPQYLNFGKVLGTKSVKS